MSILLDETAFGSCGGDGVKEQSKQKSDKRFWVILAGIVLLLIGMRLFVLDWIWISGESMLPTLKNEELVLAEKISRYAGGISCGDVVIVSYPNGIKCVKRVLGIEGDVLEIQDNQLFRNGQAIEEPYLYETTFQNFEKVTVPENCVFVMGDNRNNSADSRDSHIGAIPEQNVIGHVLCVIFPIDQLREIQ